ncbi:tubulin delta chain-like [Chanos chanos]|uniref:Tubulin delta chain n=1 Tax=Chanos chanos TaxID=29144 RepID=A0A6J2W5M7_CHACN|nr:tubulin delta chain-like [Chanos chanos]
MSAVVLQVGQCGNQLGFEWWGQLRKRAKQCPFSTKDGTLAAVCVDSESKVLRGASQFLKAKKLRQCNIVQGKGGRGTNWAYGYHGHRGAGENKLLLEAMESIRREAERRDYFGGTVLFHSLSGGTGSGLGSRLCEEIREEFPLAHILTVSVMAHQSGESPLQHYNTLLSLASLHRSVDCLLLFDNDYALSSAGVPRRPTLGPPSPSSGPTQGSFSAVNTHIASCVAGLLMPVQSLHTKSGLSLGAEPWELIRSVCPLPAAKLLYSTQACASESVHWDRLVSSTLQSLPQLSPTGKPYSSRAVLAVARGDQDNSFIMGNALKKLKQGHRCVQWNPFPVDYWTDPCNEVGTSFSSRLLTVCSNHSSVSRLLEHVVQRASLKIAVGAYLHWYENYGVERQDFQLAVDAVSDVILEYDRQ